MDMSQVQTAPGDYRKCLQEKARARGLDKPVFFISFQPLSEPDSLHRLSDPKEREAAKRLAWEYGNWPLIEAFRIEIQAYLDAEHKTFREAIDLDTASQEQFRVARDICVSLLRNGQPERIGNHLQRLEMTLSSNSRQVLQPAFLSLRHRWDALDAQPQRWRTYIPWIHWQGFDTQYLHWLGGVILRLDFGTDNDNVKVINRIRGLLPTTMLFTGWGIFLGFVISIPLALWSVRHAGQKRERAVGVLLFSLDSVPSFWMALMLLTFLADPERLGWFPSTYEAQAAFWPRLHSMALPLFAYTYGSLAFLTRSLRGSLLEIQQEPYVRTALALGYSDRRILWRHSLRPALLPMITIIGKIFPAMVGGSVILENIFSINGIGQSMLSSSLDGTGKSLVLTLFTLSAILTLLGYFVADLLYTWADPRIRFHASSTSS